MQKKLGQAERELKIRNYGGKTIKSYLYGLKKYFSYKKQSFENLDIDNIKDFLLFCQNKGVSAQTRNLFLNAIKFYYRNVVNIISKIEIRSAKKNKNLSLRSRTLIFFEK